MTWKLCHGPKCSALPVSDAVELPVAVSVVVPDGSSFDFVVWLPHVCFSCEPVQTLGDVRVFVKKFSKFDTVT